VLVTSLVVMELIYSEMPKEKRKHLVYFYPLFIVLTSLLLYAIYTQMGKK
jgi:hypothetical protein